MERGRWSTGCEIEGVVIVQVEGTQPDIPKIFQEHTGHPIIMTLTADRMINNREVHRQIETEIKRSLTQRPGTAVLPTEQKKMDPRNTNHLMSYRTWRVISESLDGIKELQESYPGYTLIPFEVISPALWAIDESFEEIQEVCQILQRKFWTLMPESCGLHFHVARGFDWIPLHDLRRVAGLAYAADPLLSKLQPESRRISSWCKSNRLYSYLAHQLTVQEVDQKFGYHNAQEETEIPDLSQVVDLKKHLSPSRKLGFRRRLSRDELRGYIPDPLEYYRNDPENDTAGGVISLDQVPKTFDPQDIQTASRQLLLSTDCRTVAELMRLTKDKPAYNFRSYQDPWYLMTGLRRTIEFRQPAATTDPDEIVAHGKTYVRMCEWASIVDLATYWSVILKCAYGESNGEYDAFDLLVDLDLIPEAELLQEIAIKRQHVTLESNNLNKVGTADILLQTVNGPVKGRLGPSNSLALP
jgi:hypothetical protein